MRLKTFWRSTKPSEKERRNKIFPLELKKLPNFIGWKLTGEKKMPMNIHTGAIGSSTDAACRGSYEQAKEAVKKYGFTGIGFCLEAPYIGIDLDDCVVNGVPNEFAQEVIKRTKSYTEYSPSGTGIHIIARGPLEEAVKTPKIEIYQTGRYFTVSERPLNGIRSVTNTETARLEDLYVSHSRQSATAGATDQSWIKQKLDEVKEGNRNNSFAAIAGLLRDKGFSQEDIFELLKPKAIELSFDLQELASVCRSIGRYKPTQQHTESEDNSFLSFIEDEEEIKWIIPEVIGDNTINIVAGLQESRKSWLLLDLAIALSTETAWLGKYIPTKKCKVLLIDQERPKAEMKRRLKALLKAKDIPFKMLQDQLIPKAGTTYRINLDQSYEALTKLIDKERPDVVLMDSLKASVSCDITDNKAMQDVFEKIKHIRNTMGTTFIFLHHENKGAYQRDREGNEITAETIAGASVINEVPEGLFVAVKHGQDASMLHHVKNSYGLKQSPFAFVVKDLTEDKSQIAVECI